MFVPFLSSRSTNLERRKGGGGKGKGSSSSSGKTSSSSSSSSSGSSKSSSGSSKTKTTKNKVSKTQKNKSKFPDLAKTSTVSPFMMGGAMRSATVYGYGGGAASVIPAGEMFAGRSVGGWSRDQIFGTKTYGSGYPGLNGRGTAGRGFPFYFWPVVWGGTAGAAVGGTVALTDYLHGGGDYGQPTNTSRPGGAMAAASFPSDTTSTVFRVVSDSATITDLIDAIKNNCSSPLDNSASSSSPSPYQDYPRADQVIQYYRASSIALTLDGYVNNATAAPEGTADTPLPSGVDMALLDCLNQTIGAAAPLVDGAAGTVVMRPVGLVGLVYVVWTMMSLL